MNVKTADFLRRAKKLIKKNGFIILLGAAGLLLVAAASGWASPSNTAESSKQDYCAGYVGELEARLARVVCSVAGVDDCTVMITLRSGVEYVYATDGSNDTDVSAGTDSSRRQQSESKVATVDDKQAGEKAVVVTELYPEINGVAVICCAPASPSLELALKNAAATALGVDSGKVCIILKG